MSALPECRSGLGSEEGGVCLRRSSGSADDSLHKGVTSHLFFGQTTGAAYGDLDLTIHPLARRSWMYSFTSENKGFGTEE